MLAVSNLNLRFRGAGAPILQNVSFTVNAGQRVGLIGPNGCGKTTLIRVITGHLEPDAGSVQFTPPGLRLGYLPQALAVDDDAPVGTVLFPEVGALAAAEADVERLAAALADAGDDYDRVADAYATALERLERLSRQIDPVAADRVLVGLDLAGLPLATPAGRLSGGQKTRLGLAAVLLRDPQLLILDEPTNHLDVTGIEWLERWLAAFDGGVLLVSHDRAFLDAVVTHVVALEPGGRARTFEGGYSHYAAVVRSEFDRQYARWRDQQAEIARLQADVQFTMAKAVRRENATHNDFQRRLARKVAKRAQAKETRLERYRESEERVEKPIAAWPLRLGALDPGEPLPSGREILTLEQAAIGYDPGAPLLSGVNLRLLAGDRVAVLGPNGQGKTTLLRTVVGALPPLAGRVRLGASVRLGYLAQEQEILDPASTPLATLLDATGMAETAARTFLHRFLFSGDEVFRPVAQLSFGERACLMLALLAARGANLLVLDEPVNHLDVPARERFEAALAGYRGSLLAVIHDRYFVARCASKIWRVEGGQVAESLDLPAVATA